MMLSFLCDILMMDVAVISTKAKVLSAEDFVKIGGRDGGKKLRK